MYLFYVYGSGLGHLNRILNFIFTEKIPSEKCIILTNSDFINFIPNDFLVIKKDTSFFKTCNFTSFLEEIINKYNISELIVDVFPSGFHGELSELSKLKLKTTLLARILKDDYFKTHTTKPLYDSVYTMENGVKLKNYEFKESKPYHLKNRIINTSSFKKIITPCFYIIHSFPSEEVQLLYKQALLHRTNEHIYIQTFANISFQIDKNTTILHQQHMHFELLKKAEKIFTGCGFNTILETEIVREKQYIIPFKRRYDNQFRRNKYIKKTS